MIYTTLQSYQVLQRDSDNQARVKQADGQIVELPVGGPYTVGDAHDILVGDIWVLAGQSNMEGIGNLVDVESPSPFVHSFQSREEWAIAEEPLHWLGESPRIVHHQLWGFDKVPDEIPPRDPQKTKGAGLGLTFAKERYIRTGVPIGLIPSAHGGTSMEQWDPANRDVGDASLYGALLKRVEKVGGKIAGVLWYQGESDAYPEATELYHQRMHTLVTALRADLQAPDLPFYYVQIGRFIRSIADPDADVCWSGMREAQRTWQDTLPHTAMVATIDLELDDLIHIGTQGLKRLGRRLADCVDGLRSPDISSVVLERERARIRITYRYVRGGLHAHGLPGGFSLRDQQGVAIPAIYKTILEGNVVTLHLTEEPLPEGAALWYGWGADPYCNITDSADMAIPAFGPWLLI